MAFLSPAFEYDVFVSYSHGDPGGVRNTLLTHWTSEFIRALEMGIRTIEPEWKALDIWFDAKIDPTKDLSDELRNKVKSSAILMVVMSPPYLSSAWCNDELKWFHEQIADRKRSQGRVFVIHALQTDKSKWPAFLQDDFGNTNVGYPFHEPERGMPYGWGEEDILKSGKKFHQQLWILQDALAKRLRELANDAPKRAALEPRPGAAQRIYLHARPEPEYANLRDRLRGDLELEGLRPMPASPAAKAGTGLDEWVKEGKRRFEDAKRCAAMALVRADDDDEFIHELYKIGVDERELIQEAREGRPLPCAVLDGSGKSLDFDCPAYDINRFDLAQQNWRHEFRAWFDAQTQAPGRN